MRSRFGGHTCLGKFTEVLGHSIPSFVVAALGEDCHACTRVRSRGRIRALIALRPPDACRESGFDVPALEHRAAATAARRARIRGAAR